VLLGPVEWQIQFHQTGRSELVGLPTLYDRFAFVAIFGERYANVVDRKRLSFSANRAMSCGR
jgi:hypothetical protein